MARIRTIKPEFFKHWDLYKLESETGLPLRIAYAGLWTVCDREGRFKWIPQQLKIDVLPYDDLDFSRVLDVLTTRGFIRKYASNNIEYGVVPSFMDHQVINNRERASELPEPIDFIEPLTRGPRVDDACTKSLDPAYAEGKGREGKGKEGEVLLSFQENDEKDEVKEAFNIYNETAKELDLPIAQKLSTTRKTGIKNRLKDCGGLDGWHFAMQQLRESGHCQGQNNRGWRADLDFILKASSFTKLMEGSYQTKSPEPPKPPKSETDRIFDELREKM